MLTTTAIFAFGIIGLIVGRRTWSGQEYGFVQEHHHRQGERTARGLPLGGIRLYRTVFGAGHVGIPLGGAMMAISGTELLRLILGRSGEWWLMLAIGYTSAAITVLTGLYLFAYFWVGVPDWMRPPAQRGWRLTKHGYELVRPEAVPPHLREPQRREQERW